MTVSGSSDSSSLDRTQGVYGRFAQAYLCPDPAEHGELVFVMGISRPPSILRGKPARWERLDPTPVCPICGVEMVHDTDERLEA